MNNKRTLKDISVMEKNVPTFEIIEDSIYFILDGPVDSLYENGKWKIRINIPKEYPYKSPSVGFVNKIFHPNIDENSGSICLDVLNQEWAPIYSLINIYETFLPQLLTYPNPDDPLNTYAADLMVDDYDKYKAFVLEHKKTNSL